jgi:hypothetical protein
VSTTETPPAAPPVTTTPTPSPVPTPEGTGSTEPEVVVGDVPQPSTPATGQGIAEDASN